MAKKREVVDAGSGDVFVDLGFADASERRLRVQLAMQVNELIARRRLTQDKAAALLGIPQPHVSELKHYKLSRFSSERLLTIPDVARPRCEDRDSAEAKGPRARIGVGAAWLNPLVGCVRCGPPPPARGGPHYAQDGRTYLLFDHYADLLN